MDSRAGGRMDEWTDGRTDGWTNGRTDRQTDPHIRGRIKNRSRNSTECKRLKKVIDVKDTNKRSANEGFSPALVREGRKIRFG